MNRYWILNAFVLLFVFWLPRAAPAQQIYWIDNDAGNKIMRSNIDGSGAVTLVEGSISTFTIDADDGHIYWGADGVPFGTIRRSDLDGSNTVLIADSGATTTDIAIDRTNGKIYWTDFAVGKIQRANLDGSDIELLIQNGLHVTGIDLDVAAGKMYYAVTSLDTIQRADLDGGNIEVLVTTTNNVSNDIVLDLDAGKMYLSGIDIQRANFDGTGMEFVLNDGASVAGMSLDLSSGHIYWANLFFDKIRRAKLDGSDIEDVVIGANNPKRIALTQPAPCLADLNGDGVVDTADLGVLLGAFGSVGAPGSIIGDINNDGVIDTADLGILLAGFGSCPV